MMRPIPRTLRVERGNTYMIEIQKRIRTVNIIHNANRLQIGIPADFCRELNLVKGQQVIVILESDNSLTLRPNDGSISIADEMQRLLEGMDND